MSISPIIIAIGLALLVLAGCGFAFFKGGPAERAGSAVIAANLALLWLADMMQNTASSGVFGLVVDGFTAIGLLIVVLRYGSLWLGGAMLLYAAQFTLRAFYFVSERPTDNFFKAMNNLDFMGILLCLVVGTAVAWRRRTRMVPA